ncbi:RagB/SusD family nutrient uptake outer membrane protein [Sphingobacterium sp. HJSM2_6]|uniref:RagB/SusD family nutrient uptake outer membrane protein n=1 Tax=Sphingobacterium sp. HJSM2_6 TaxID=3366264 RepID=UPI003BE8D6BB
MKTLNKFAIPLLALVLTASSCAKKLDLEPVDNISSDVALEDANDVNNALIGAYTIIAKASLYGTNLIMVPDLYASPDYVLWTGSFDTYRQFYNQTVLAQNEDITRTWTDAYQAINIANTVLESLNVVTDEEQKAEIQGKALFIRGIMYFELVRLYGLPYEAGTANSQLGVPISLKAVKAFEDIIADVKRSTVAEGYTQAENDLTQAISLLTEYPSDLNAAKGMLARLYLQQSKFDQARDLADEVINSGDYNLIDNLESPFRIKNSNEGVFEIQQNQQSNAGSSNDGLATFYSNYLNNSGGEIGRGDLSIEPAYINSFESGDLRVSLLMYPGINSGTYSKKWYNYFDNIPVVRLTELYLTRAECNFRLSTNVGDTPLNDLNTLRTRAGVTPFNTLTLEQILTERDRELSFEGYRLHDLKRTKRTVGSLPYNSGKLVFPIPARERAVNPQLEQNPGYAN